MENLFKWLVAIFSGTFFLGANALPSEKQSLYFWPTPIKQSSVSDSRMPFLWPDYQVLLHDRDDKKKYTCAAITEQSSCYLSNLFHPEDDSPIKIVRDGRLKFWGLEIPGGSIQRDANIRLLEPISGYFFACLGTLDEHELEKIERVFYVPEPFLVEPGLEFDSEYFKIAAKLYSNFQNNLCAENKNEVPSLLKNKIKVILEAMLFKPSQSIMTDAAIVTFTVLFNKILFSSNGLWMKVTLEEIKNFVLRRIENFPEINELAWAQRNYESFLDFIILTRQNTPLHKYQYITISRALGLNQAQQLFDQFPLSQLVTSNRISIINLNIGNKTSTHFVPGEFYE